MLPFKNHLIRLFLVLVIFLPCVAAQAQQVTGVWSGKIDRKKVEVKIIQKGDSLTGTSYYYESAAHYLRYSIKGYFDPNDNSVVWWDDQLIESKGMNSGRSAFLSVADFNCPGGGQMFLDGQSAPKNQQQSKSPVNLTKIGNAQFPDEWDYVIDNYTTGTNDPVLIDSIGLIAVRPMPATEPVVIERPVITETKLPPPPAPVIIAEPAAKPEPIPALTIEEKLNRRKKEFTKEIPVEGDSIELRFYDNAQIDGDSISLFLDDQLIFTHVRLSDKAYSIKLPVKNLKENSELIMVAENLGSIPPNTSYMVAIVGENRYDAFLASTEESSAMIKLKKKSL